MVESIKFSINQLINKEDWLEMYIPKDTFNVSLFKFQIKSIQEIDKSKLALEKLENKMFLEQGKIILLTIDLINTSKSIMQKGNFDNEIVIQDSEGYCFEHSTNEVFYNSEFSKGYSFNLRPRKKRKIVLFFLIPDEDSDYFISIKNPNWNDFKLKLTLQGEYID